MTMKQGIKHSSVFLRLAIALSGMIFYVFFLPTDIYFMNDNIYMDGSLYEEIVFFLFSDRRYYQTNIYPFLSFLFLIAGVVFLFIQLHQSKKEGDQPTPKKRKILNYVSLGCYGLLFIFLIILALKPIGSTTVYNVGPALILALLLTVAILVLICLVAFSKKDPVYAPMPTLQVSQGRNKVHAFRSSEVYLAFAVLLDLGCFCVLGSPFTQDYSTGLFNFSDFSLYGHLRGLTENHQPIWIIYYLAFYLYLLLPFLALLFLVIGMSRNASALKRGQVASKGSKILTWVSAVFFFLTAVLDALAQLFHAIFENYGAHATSLAMIIGALTALGAIVLEMMSLYKKDVAYGYITLMRTAQPVYRGMQPPHPAPRPNMTPSKPTPKVTATAEDAEQEKIKTLKSFYALYQQGVISKEEYESKKAAILQETKTK
jgi:hypothetical protein